MNANDLTIRAGSTHHETGGTVHQVTGGFYHGSYNDDNLDYNVAVLRVCNAFHIQLDFSKYMMCFQWYEAYLILRFMQWWFCNLFVQIAATYHTYVLQI